MGLGTMEIATSSGNLAVVEAEGLLHAHGIPYATAERFEPPRPVHTPELQRDASRRGPACPQDPDRLTPVIGSIVGELEQREECLGLSVTAPIGAFGLPVMVWFAAFGGAPDQVTVFGQSAGGDSVMALLASEQTRGRFTARSPRALHSGSVVTAGR
jgi:carboxylesterase type B